MLHRFNHSSNDTFGTSLNLLKVYQNRDNYNGMICWKVRGLDGQKEKHGWLVAMSTAEACDIARRENAVLDSEPMEWSPMVGACVFWMLDQSPNSNGEQPPVSFRQSKPLKPA